MYMYMYMRVCVYICVYTYIRVLTWIRIHTIHTISMLVLLHGYIAQKRGTYVCPLELHTHYKSCRTPINCDKSKNTRDRSRCSHANALDHHTTTHIPHIYHQIRNSSMLLLLMPHATNKLLK